MRYVVEVNGERVHLTVEGGGVRVHDAGEDATGGAVVATHLEEVGGTPVVLVRVGNEVHRVAVARGEARGAYTLQVGARRLQVEALDERTRTIRDMTAAAAGPSGPRPLVAPMPGLVVKVHVAVGDVVEPGKPLVSMEAMKMENELRSPGAGTVKAILATPGQAVEKGAVLVELE